MEELIFLVNHHFKATSTLSVNKIYLGYTIIRQRNYQSMQETNHYNYESAFNLLSCIL